MAKCFIRNSTRHFSECTVHVDDAPLSWVQQTQLLDLTHLYRDGAATYWSSKVSR